MSDAGELTLDIGFEIYPADDAANDRRLIGQAEKKQGLVDGRCRLDDDRPVDAAFGRHALQILRQAVLTQRCRVRRLHPPIIAARDAPEMLMGVDDHGMPQEIRGIVRDCRGRRGV